jgi:probable phosphoglycerate mutase
VIEPQARVAVEADGGARGNPGPAGFGAVVRSRTGEVLAERYGYLGIATNNVAEYQGLIAGLAAAAELDAREVEIRMDSKLVIEQMAGRWQIKHPGLRPLAAQAAALVRGFETVTYTWIPRDQNKLADALANKAMDTQESGGSSGSVGWSAGAGSWEIPPDKPTRLMLIRHGETAMTQEKRYSGRHDVPLTEHGLAQAQATAQRVAALGVPVSAVVSSPLIRCVRTAEAIAGALGDLPVITADGLIECDFGDWDGLTFGEVRKRFGAELDVWLSSTAISPPGGESFQRVAKRAQRVIAELITAYPAQCVVVVSHVSPIKLVLRDALAAGDALLHRLYLDPAGISVVDYWPDGGVAVRSVNDTSHVTSEN